MITSKDIYSLKNIGMHTEGGNNHVYFNNNQYFINHSAYSAFS